MKSLFVLIGSVLISSAALAGASNASVKCSARAATKPGLIAVDAWVPGDFAEHSVTVTFLGENKAETQWSLVDSSYLESEKANWTGTDVAFELNLQKTIPHYKEAKFEMDSLVFPKSGSIIAKTDNQASEIVITAIEGSALVNPKNKDEIKFDAVVSTTANVVNASLPTPAASHVLMSCVYDYGI